MRNRLFAFGLVTLAVACGSSTPSNGTSNPQGGNAGSTTGSAGAAHGAGSPGTSNGGASGGAGAPLVGGNGGSAGQLANGGVAGVANSSGGNAGSAASGGMPSAGGGGGGGAPRDSFYVTGNSLLDPCGNKVVLRGINHNVMVFADSNCSACAEMAQTGANAIRMMWLMAKKLSDAEAAVTAAVGLGMIPILELHDATGAWSKVGAVRDYWINADSVAFIKKHQSHLIVNFANEPADNQEVSEADFKAFFSDALPKMRSAGIHVPIMLDAFDYGRNGEALLDAAPDLQQADPDHNLIFSWHEYDTGSAQPARIEKLMQDSVTKQIPFVVGEFGYLGTEINGSTCFLGVPVVDLITSAQKYGVGYLPWSWEFNSNDKTNDACAIDNTGTNWNDMTVDGKFAGLKTSGGYPADWAGEVALSDPSSIKKTSVRSPFLATGTCPK